MSPSRCKPVESGSKSAPMSKDVDGHRAARKRARRMRHVATTPPPPPPPHPPFRFTKKARFAQAIQTAGHYTHSASGVKNCRVGLVPLDPRSTECPAQ